MTSDYQAAIDEFLEVSGRLLGLGTPTWIEQDLSFPQVKTLFVLARFGPLPVGQLAQMLQVGSPTASHLIEKLVQAGFAERLGRSEDRRVVEVQATDEGKAFTQRLVGLRDAPVAKMIMQMAPEDMTTLRRGLRALLDILRADMEKEKQSQRHSTDKERSKEKEV